MKKKNFKNIFIHETSFVDDKVIIGDGTKIWHFSHISESAKIGKNVIIGQNVFIGKGVQIGKGSKIQNNVSVYEGVKIEEDVFVGPSVVFTNVKEPRAFIEQKNNFKQTIIKKGSAIGANSTIVCGCTIGRYAMIGASSLVTKSVKNFSLSYGSPAKHIRFIEKKTNK